MSGIPVLLALFLQKSEGFRFCFHMAAAADEPGFPLDEFRLRLSASTLVPLVLCALYPVVWYAVLRNHSMIHAYMTHRALAVTVMALGCAISGSLQKPSPSLKVDRA